MKEEIEFYINENGITCVPLKMYNDSLEEIERLNNIIKEVRELANNIKFETKREEKIQDDILEILDRVGNNEL